MDFLKKTDYTHLSPFDSDIQMEDFCIYADELGVASICIEPQYIILAKDVLVMMNSNVKVCTVISFPHGNDHTNIKLQDTLEALKNGADEIDMVLDYRMLKKSKNKEKVFSYLKNQVSQIKDLCDIYGAILKVIVESGEISSQEVVTATEICLLGGADYIKTSTGKTENGANLADIKLMRETIIDYGIDMKIKASGGIRDIEKIKTFNSYVDRFGIGDMGVDNILNGVKSESNY